MTETTPPCRIVVLISGSGTNLQALIDAQANDQLAGAEIVGVFSNRPDVQGLARAESAGIPAQVLDHKTYPDRETFDQAMQKALDAWQPDLLVLAGFMRILTPEFVEHFAGRMLNIHPSLLPKYPGLHTHERALAAGDSVHGTTIHFVTSELDGGPPVVQAQVPVEPDDDPQTLAQRVQRKEHQMYPATVRWFAQGRLTFGKGAAYMDGTAIDPHGINWDDIIDSE